MFFGTARPKAIPLRGSPSKTVHVGRGLCVEPLPEP